MKTNCKKAIDNIRSYVVRNMTTENYGIEQPTNFKEAAKIIFDCFWNEYMHGYNLKRNHQQCFIDWLSGLPSVFDSCYYYNRSAVEDLGNILEETEEEKAKYNDTQAAEMLSRLIYREITKAIGKY